MNIQIFGRPKCFDTKKAERYFKERNIKYQLIDLDRYGLSKKELRSVFTSVDFEELMDKKSKNYERYNFPFITRTDEDIIEIISGDFTLLISPIVRSGRAATAGYRPEVWKTWE